MFIALDENKNRISIDKVDKTKQYFCPVCDKQLSVKATDSLSVKAHFAHKKGTECIDTWQHDMSNWHHDWQCLFPEKYREVVVEKDGVKHRADILVNGFVIEFQHSPIKAEEIQERNNFYLNCGYKVIWVFDADNKIKNIEGAEYSIDPFRATLEWKRARREFDIPTPEGVSVFIEYITDIDTLPPQTTRIMLFLTKFDPKNIHTHNTKPQYITRGNFLKQLGFNIENVDSITDILKRKQYIAYKQRMIPQRPYKKHFKF